MFLLPGTWGIYPWFEEDGEELIEERHRDEFRELKPYGKIFRCVGERDEFIELQYNSHSYLVKPQLFKKVPTPKFNFGDTVRLRKKPEVIGTISESTGIIRLKKKCTLLKWTVRKSHPIF